MGIVMVEVDMDTAMGRQRPKLAKPRFHKTVLLQISTIPKCLKEIQMSRINNLTDSPIHRLTIVLRQIKTKTQ